MLTVKETPKVLQIIRKKAVKKHNDPAQGFWAALWTVFSFLPLAVDIDCCKIFWVFCRKVEVITYGKMCKYSVHVFYFIRFAMHNWPTWLILIYFDSLLYFSTNIQTLQVCLSQAMRISAT